MTVVDLHPEDLLEKDAQGSLEAGERTRLEAHLAHCVACRMERQLRVDFAGELAEEIPLDRVVGLGIEAAVAPPPRDSIVVLRGTRRHRHRAVWLLAAAVLLVGGAAAAAMGLGETRWAIRSATTSAPAEASPPVATHAKVHAAAAPAEVREPEGVASSAEAIVVPVTPPLAAPPRPRVASVATAAPVVGPAELFEAASEARRRADYGSVLDIDRDLEQRYPTSREAQVSREIVGRLLLDRADPAGALAKFTAYLSAGGGDLGEEAMVGRATALERLGRTDDATRAWSALAAAYPDSPYAARARARLESSNGR